MRNKKYYTTIAKGKDNIKDNKENRPSRIKKENFRFYAPW